MKHFNNIIRFFIISILFLCFTACSDTALNNNQEEGKDNQFTVSGKIKSDISGRSAVSSFTLPSGSHYSVAACFGTPSGEPPVYTWDTSETGGEVNSSTSTYSVTLTKAGHWKLILYLVDPSGVSTELVSQEIDVDNTTSQTTTDLVIKNKFTSGEVSNISLKVSRAADSTDIQNITWQWNDPGITMSDSVKKFDEGTYENGMATVTFDFTDVPVGKYNVSFIISKTSGDEYSFDEIINVADIFTTDTWYGDSIWLTKDINTEQYSFIVSNELLNTQPKYREFQSTEDNTLYLLYSEQPKEYMGIDWNTGEPGYDANYGMKGAQVFAAINGHEKISKPMFESTNFCFGNNCTYVMETEEGSFVINKYIESYAGYKKGSTLKNLTSFCESPDEISRITYSNNSIYLFYKKSSVCGLAKIGVDSSYASCKTSISGITELPLTLAVTAETNGSNQTSGTMFYAVKDSGTSTLYRQTFTVDETNSTLTVSGSNLSYELNLTNLGFTSYGDILFGDLIIQQDPTDDKYYLYALLYTFGVCKSLYQNPYDDYYWNTGNGLFISTGGVLRFDVEGSSANLTPTDWNKDGNIVTVLGLHTKQAPDYNLYDSDEGTPNIVLSADSIYACQPYDADTYEEIPDCFYGPRRFIARKPGVLVIADDGGLFSDNCADRITAKNRVITLNLSDLAFNVKNVNVSFSTKFVSHEDSPYEFWFELQ